MKQPDRSSTTTTNATHLANNFSKLRRALRASVLRVPAINMIQFMVLCGLFDGVDTSGTEGAKASLVEAAQFGIWKTDAARDDVVDEEFADGTPESLKASLAALDEERREFVELAAVIDELDHDAADVILKGVAQVYADSDHVPNRNAFYARCVRVYQIMQGIA